MLSEEVKTGELQPDLWVPLEDLYNGWEKSGQVGQEVYGAGIAFGVVPRQYIKIEEDFLVFIDYPNQYTKRGKSITIRLDGDKDLTCNLKILKIGDRNIKVKISHGNIVLKPFKENMKIHEYEVSGQGKLKIQW
jgi:hypothetical protein